MAEALPNVIQGIAGFEQMLCARVLDAMIVLDVRGQPGFLGIRLEDSVPCFPAERAVTLARHEYDIGRHILGPMVLQVVRKHLPLVPQRLALHFPNGLPRLQTALESCNGEEPNFLPPVDETLAGL